MRQIKYCEHCGAKMMEYRHKLNAMMIKSLHRFWESSPPINLKDVDLTFNERANFQKMRYWGLIKKYNSQGQRVDGVWILTEKGEKFLSCKLAISQFAITYRNETIRFDGKMVYANDLWDEINYKKRPEYIEDAEPHLNFED